MITSLSFLRRWSNRPSKLKHSIFLTSRKLRNFGLACYCPICANHLRCFLPSTHKMNPRANVRCPICNSRIRHRLVWLYVQKRTNLFSLPRKKMLHIAPEAYFAPYLQNHAAIDYVTGDITPYAKLQMDITALPFATNTFEVVFALHVLEHIPNDHQAMCELWRVLKPQGWAILQVPLRGDVTYEDPSIVEPQERERHFGQWNHVRVYGWDYLDRLKRAGFSVYPEKTVDFLTKDEARHYGVSLDKAVFYCVKESSAVSV